MSLSYYKPYRPYNPYSVIRAALLAGLINYIFQDANNFILQNGNNFIFN